VRNANIPVVMTILCTAILLLGFCIPSDANAQVTLNQEPHATIDQSNVNSPGGNNLAIVNQPATLIDDVCSVTISGGGTVTVTLDGVDICFR
jgi:hypothetical protein